jgi:hypothetical protein
VIFHESLDLVEVQGRYNGVFSRGLKLRRGRTIGSESQGSLDSHVKSCIGVS